MKQKQKWILKTELPKSWKGIKEKLKWKIGPSTHVIIIKNKFVETAAQISLDRLHKQIQNGVEIGNFSCGIFKVVFWCAIIMYIGTKSILLISFKPCHEALVYSKLDHTNRLVSKFSKIYKVISRINMYSSTSLVTGSTVRIKVRTIRD